METREIMVQPLADGHSDMIGRGTRIWQFCVVLSGAELGEDCNVCAQVLIESGVKIGNRVTIKSGVQLWEGVTIEDDVFIGPNVTFTNDLVPRSKVYPEHFVDTYIEQGASIGANATIIAGHRIGKYAFIAAGSVVTKEVPDNTFWMGNPARQVGFVTNEGILLDMNFCDKQGKQYRL